MSDSEELAINFHDTYERLAPIFGYETREETKEFDPESANGQLMIAVCECMVKDLKAQLSKAPILPKGEPMPQTVEAWSRLYGLAEKVMLEDKERHSAAMQLNEKYRAKIKKIEAQLSNQWVSVETDRPDTHETEGNFHASEEVAVLCAGRPEFALYQFGPDSGGWESWYCHYYEDTLENVTHWMKLPQLPEPSQ